MPDNRVKIVATLDDKVSGGLAKIRDSLDRVGGKGTGQVAFGVAAAKGLDLIGVSAKKVGEFVGDFIHDSIQAASNLNETMSKSNIVFGNAASQVSRWGNTSAEAFGLSKQAAVEAAASFGNVFKGLGFIDTKSADMSERLVQLAGDLASFNNVDPNDALDKLRSGLAGEAEPLRRFGIFLNESVVKAKAMQMGLGDAHGELTEGEKILARYQLILEQTSTAQGDFARTSDQLANSQRKKNAELENAQAALGEKLLPAQLAVTNAQIDFFTSLNALGDAFAGKLTPEVLAFDKALGETGEHFKNIDLKTLDRETIEAGVALGYWTRQAADAALGIHSMDDALDGMADKSAYATVATYNLADAHGDLSDKSAYATVKATELGDATEEASSKMIIASMQTRESLIKDAETLVTGYYDKLTKEDRLSATNAEITQIRRRIANGKATSDDKVRLHELEQTQSELLLDLAGAGASSDKTVKAGIAQLMERLKTAHGEERDAILAEIKALKMLADQARITKVGFNNLKSSGGLSGARAKGGPVEAGHAYLVNEDTPRSEVFVPNEPGYIYPQAQPSAMGPMSTAAAIHHTHIYLDGRQIAEVVDQYNAAALQRAAPAAIPA